MDDHKIDNFALENEGVAFPSFDSLSPEECNLVRKEFCVKLGLQDDCGLQLVHKISERQEFCTEISAESSHFDLRELMNSIRIIQQDSVCVNWYRFDKIDRIAFADFAKFFGNIWYPASDDIDIFDSSFLWILSISHEGHVSWISFG
jgi:hypothetical protein